MSTVVLRCECHIWHVNNRHSQTDLHAGNDGDIGLVILSSYMQLQTLCAKNHGNDMPDDDSNSARW